MIGLVFLIFAFVLFILAAVGVPSPARFNLVPAGLAFCVAYVLFTGRLAGF